MRPDELSRIMRLESSVRLTSFILALMLRVVLLDGIGSLLGPVTGGLEAYYAGPALRLEAAV